VPASDRDAGAGEQRDGNRAEEDRAQRVAPGGVVSAAAERAERELTRPICAEPEVVIAPPW
jgi:hypothetical protein